MNQKEPVVFKSEDSLWQMLRQGIKTWDARRFDVADERIHRLSLGHWEKNPPVGRLAYYVMDEVFICFLNKLTDQTLQFRYRGFITPGWAPGWCFLQLGGLVATYDKDGAEIKK
jgi:hypothetical protein